MTDLFLIPLTNTPQEFPITLGDRDLILVSKWNDSFEGGWTLDILDDNANAPIVCNIPLVTGVDLLEQYEYLGLKAKLVVYTDGDASAVSTLDNLGTDSNLYYQAVI
jgi:hypothetical protein